MGLVFWVAKAVMLGTQTESSAVSRLYPFAVQICPNL